MAWQIKNAFDGRTGKALGDITVAVKPELNTTNYYLVEGQVIRTRNEPRWVPDDDGWVEVTLKEDEARLLRAVASAARNEAQTFWDDPKLRFVCVEADYVAATDGFHLCVAPTPHDFQKHPLPLLIDAGDAGKIKKGVNKFPVFTGNYVDWRAIVERIVEKQRLVAHDPQYTEVVIETSDNIFAAIAAQDIDYAVIVADRAFAELRPATVEILSGLSQRQLTIRLFVRNQSAGYVRAEYPIIISNEQLMMITMPVSWREAMLHIDHIPLIKQIVKEQKAELSEARGNAQCIQIAYKAGDNVSPVAADHGNIVVNRLASTLFDAWTTAA